MAEASILRMKAVAERLNGLGLDYACLGGSVVGLLLDHPELSPVRATDDVYVVIEVVYQARYAGIEQKLRALKCDHDMRESAPRCRWVLGTVTVDIMPPDGDFLGLNTAWFGEALASATPRPVNDNDNRRSGDVWLSSGAPAGSGRDLAIVSRWVSSPPTTSPSSIAAPATTTPATIWRTRSPSSTDGRGSLRRWRRPPPCFTPMSPRLWPR